MAQQADGTVYINSSIDTDGVETGGKRLESAFKRVANTAKTAVGSIRSGMQSINQAMSANLDTSGFDTMQDKIDTLSEHLKSLEAQGISFGYAEYDQTYQQLVLAENELKQYKATLAETALAEQNATQTTGLMQSVLNALAGAAHAPISALQLLGNAIRQIPHATLSLVSSGLHKIADAAKTAAKRIGSSLVSSLKKAVSNLKKAAVAMLSFHKNTQKSNGSLGTSLKTILKYGLGIRSLYALFNKMRSAIKEGFQNLAQYSDETNRNISALMSSLTQLKNSLATAFNPILSIVTPILTKFIDMLSKAATYVGMLFAALTGKNSFVKAVKVQEDYAASLGDTADNAKKALKYLSGLDEIRTFTEEQEDSGGYQPPSPADMFETVEIPDKIKDLAQWLKDMWANADFYDLGKLLGEKLKEALDNIPWNKIKETARKLGKSIASFINGFIEVEGLGYSIGKTLAEALNTAFEFLNAFVHELHWESVGKFIAETFNGFFENIDWPLIYDTFITGAKGLGDAINSFADYLNWDAIATAISNAVNTFTNTVYTFFTTVDWRSLGQKVGQTISDALAGIDWKRLGEALAAPIRALINFAYGAIVDADWGSIGTYIADALNGVVSSIDLSMVGEILGTAFTGLFQTAIDFASTFDWIALGDNIANGINGFFEKFDGAKFAQAATSLISGLLDSIIEFASTTDWTAIWRDVIDFLTNVNWLELIGKIVIAAAQIIAGLFVGLIQAIVETDWGAVWDRIVQAFKDFFGIHSPSTLFAEFGTFLIQGLIDGINSLIESVSEIWETMKQTAIDTWESVKESVVETWENIKQSAAEKWSSIKEDISEKITNIKEKISSIMTDVKQKWSDAWNNMKEKVSSIIESVKNTIQSAFEWISEKVNSIKEKLSGIGSSISSSIGRVFSRSTYSILAPDLQVPVMPVPSIATANIPYLASGAVIPPNAPFAAILGDQKNGKNLELPENLLRKIVREESGNNGVSIKELRIPLIASGKQMLEVVITEAMLQQMASGRNPLELA